MDPNKLDLHGNGLLFVAVQHHQLAVVEFLIKSGAFLMKLKLR